MEHAGRRPGNPVSSGRAPTPVPESHPFHGAGSLPKQHLSMSLFSLSRFNPVLLLAFATLAVGAASVGRAQAPALGLHYGSDFSISQYESFSGWIGRKVMYRVSFLDKRSWSLMQDAAVIDIARSWVKSYPGRVEVLSVAMFADGDTGGFPSITNGSRNAVFEGIASRIQAAGIADRVIIRLAWEANGSWYKWSYLKDPAGFRAAFRHIVWRMRLRAPNLRFEFNVSNLAGAGLNNADWREGYPGDDAVDVISMDIYDHWNPWTRMLSGAAGLHEMREFAKAHNKPEAYTEWACSTLSNGHGDNPGFMRSMSDWMDARPGKVLYHSYWNTRDGAAGRIFGVVDVPQAAAEFKRLFGPPPASPATNTRPSISGLNDRTISANSSTGAMAFTVRDSETSAGNLTITTNSSDQLLLPLSRIRVDGTGNNRTITVTPVTNKTGWATVWVKVSDGSLTQTASFVLSVTGTNFTFTNVGGSAVAGAKVVNDPYVKMYARGYDIAGQSDQFYFAEQALRGDTELIVKVNSLSGPDAWSKAGLMFRSSTAANAAFAAVLITPDRGAILQWRTADGASAGSSAPVTAKAPQWLRLIRDGDVFHGFCSDDGQSWTWIESVTVPLPDTARSGLAVTAHDVDAGATALFQNFRID